MSSKPITPFIRREALAFGNDPQNRRAGESAAQATARYLEAWTTDWSKTAYAKKPKSAAALAAEAQRAIARSQALLGSADRLPESPAAPVAPAPPPAATLRNGTPVNALSAQMGMLRALPMGSYVDPKTGKLHNGVPMLNGTPIDGVTGKPLV